MHIKKPVEFRPDQCTKVVENGFWRQISSELQVDQLDWWELSHQLKAEKGNFYHQGHCQYGARTCNKGAWFFGETSPKNALRWNMVCTWFHLPSWICYHLSGKKKWLHVLWIYCTLSRWWLYYDWKSSSLTHTHKSHSCMNEDKWIITSF